MNRILLLTLASLALACQGGGDAITPVDDSGTGSGSGGEEGTGDDTGTTPAGCATLDNPRALDQDICVDEAPCTWTGEQSYEYFGYILDAGGDIDGDGREDVLIGSPTYDATATSTVPDAGRVVLLSGAALDAGTDGRVASLHGTQEGAFLGTTVVILGDVDGDGIDDFLSGARGATEPSLLQENAGAAVLVLGQSGGWSDGVMTPVTTFYGERAYSRVGTSLGRAGDLDGDGLADVLVAGELRDYDEVDDDESYGRGRVYVVNGRGDGAWPESLADADATLEGDASYEVAGGAMAGGDLDGDGHADLVVGAPYANGYKGGVYVLPGGPGAISGAMELADAPLELSGSKSYDVYAWAVTTGDLDGDGDDELVVGAPLHDMAWDNAGAVFVYDGGPGFFDPGPETLATYTGEFDDHELGSGLSAGRDVTGDGVGDLVMGAVKTWVGVTTKSGKTYVVPGGSTWPDAPVSAAEAPIILHGSGNEDYLGRANAAADLNGDGTADLVVGSGYTNVGGNYDYGSVYLFFGG